MPPPLEGAGEIGDEDKKQQIQTRYGSSSKAIVKNQSMSETMFGGGCPISLDLLQCFLRRMSLEKICVASWNRVVQDMEDLKASVKDFGSAEANDLAHWDLNFWSERLRESKYNIDERDGIVRTPVTPSPINGMPRNCHKMINISKLSALFFFAVARSGPKFDGAEDEEERQGSSGGQGWVAAGAARPRRWPWAASSSGREGEGGGRDEERRERETASSWRSATGSRSGRRRQEVHALLHLGAVTQAAILLQHSRGKSALIFCSTRKGAQEAAQCLSKTAESLGY